MLIFTFQTETLVADLADEEENDDDEEELNTTAIELVTAKKAVEEEYVLASCSNLLQLAAMKPPLACSCGDANVTVSSRKYGTAFVISWVR